MDNANYRLLTRLDCGERKINECFLPATNKRMDGVNDL